MSALQLKAEFQLEAEYHPQTQSQNIALCRRQLALPIAACQAEIEDPAA